MTGWTPRGCRSIASSCKRPGPSAARSSRSSRSRSPSWPFPLPSRRAPRCRSTADRRRTGLAAHFGAAPGSKDRASASELGVTTARWGGNPTTTYNWQIGAWNTGNDGSSRTARHLCCQGPRRQRRPAPRGRAHGSDHRLGGEGQDVGVVPGRRARPAGEDDPWHGNAGNGKDPGGKPIATEPGRAYVPVTAASVKEWVEAIRKEDAKPARAPWRCTSSTTSR